MGAFFEKLADFAICIFLSVVVVFITTIQFKVETYKQLKAHNESISEIIERIDKFEGQVKDYQGQLELLVGEDNIRLVSELESVSSLAKNNEQVLKDINGLIAKDPEKLLAIRDINTKYQILMKDMDILRGSIQKNDDRIYSGFSAREGMLWALLLLVLPVLYKIYRASNNHSEKS